MKIRTKLYIGIIFLFIEFLIVSVIGLYSTYTISGHVKMMTLNNVLSVQYIDSLLRSIDEVNNAITGAILNPDKKIDVETVQKNIDIFENELQKEEDNITEIGEKELVSSLRDKFNGYKESFGAALTNNRITLFETIHLPIYNSIKSDLFKISDINLKAILRKNAQVNNLSYQFYVLISIFVTIFFLVSFSFIFNFPGYIANPIEKITSSIKDISKKNYKLRLDYKSNDEFGELAKAFNTLMERLEKSKSKNK